MAASDHTFQADTFSLIGTAGSLIQTSNEPYVVTGSWALNVQGGNVSGFLAELTMINANGSGYRTIQLTNLTSERVELYDNGTAIIIGLVDLGVNGTEPVSVDAYVSVAKLRAVKIAVDSKNLTGTFAGEPVYGIADQPQMEAAATVAASEVGLGLSNITEKLELPELPNPLRQFR
jgi:hypothetical protein